MLMPPPATDIEPFLTINSCELNNLLHKFQTANNCRLLCFAGTNLEKANNLYHEKNYRHNYCCNRNNKRPAKKYCANHH